MSKFFVSTPVKLPASVIKAAKALNIDTSYLLNKEAEGAKVEIDVYHLLLLLDADEVFMPPSKVEKGRQFLSYLDTTLKIDILVRVGSFYLCWQVKSSMEVAKKHMELDKVTFQGKSYPAPGLIVMDSWEKGKLGWKLQVLSQVSQTSGIPVRPDVINAVEKWKKLKAAFKEKDNPKKVVTLPSSVFSPEESVNLTTLGLIQVQGTNVKIM